MKKLLFFATLFLAIAMNAQDLKTLSKDTSILEKKDLKWININDDKFEDRKFVEFKNAYYNRPYLSIKDGLMNMRFIWKYEGKDWVFFNKIVLMSNGNKIEINNLSPETEVHIGYVTERVDISGTAEIYNFIKTAIDSNSPIDIRYEGKRVYDAKFKKSDFTIFNSIFNIYDKLKK